MSSLLVDQAAKNAPIQVSLCVVPEGALGNNFGRPNLSEVVKFSIVCITPLVWCEEEGPFRGRSSWSGQRVKEGGREGEEGRGREVTTYMYAHYICI